MKLSEITPDPTIPAESLILSDLQICKEHNLTPESILADLSDAPDEFDYTEDDFNTTIFKWEIPTDQIPE